MLSISLSSNVVLTWIGSGCSKTFSLPQANQKQQHIAQPQIFAIHAPSCSPAIWHSWEEESASLQSI